MIRRDSILKFDYVSNGERVEIRTDGETYYDVVLQDMLMHRYKFTNENYEKAIEYYNNLRSL